MVMRPTAGPDTGSGHQPGAGAATPELRPYVTVRQALEALVARPVFYELAEQSVAGEDGRFGVWSDGVFFPLEAGANADQDDGA